MRVLKPESEGPPPPAPALKVTDEGSGTGREDIGAPSRTAAVPGAGAHLEAGTGSDVTGSQ